MRNYEPVRLIGAGGMGDVYEGRMRLAFGQEIPCAIKLIRKDRGHPLFREMFAREATTALTLHHHNLVRAYDFGVASDGRLFLVMELVRGPNLGAVSGTLAGRFDVLRRIARDVLLALRHLHAREVIHRDITPGNILIDRSGCIKVADLGVVKRASGSGSGGFVGVAAYASPEQRAQLSTTPASDVYSLGAVLYEQITGKRVCHEYQPRSGDEETGPPMLPDTTPADLVRLVTGCLQADPPERITVDDALRLLDRAERIASERVIREPVVIESEATDSETEDRGEADPDHTTPLADLHSVASDGVLTAFADRWLDAHREDDEKQPEPTPLALHGAVLRLGDEADDEVDDEAESEPTARPRRWLVGIAAMALGLAIGVYGPWSRNARCSDAALALDEQIECVDSPDDATEQREPAPAALTDSGKREAAAAASDEATGTDVKAQTDEANADRTARRRSRAARVRREREPIASPAGFPQYRPPIPASPGPPDSAPRVYIAPKRQEFVANGAVAPSE